MSLILVHEGAHQTSGMKRVGILYESGERSLHSCSVSSAMVLCTEANRVSIRPRLQLENSHLIRLAWTLLNHERIFVFDCSTRIWDLFPSPHGLPSDKITMEDKFGKED